MKYQASGASELRDSKKVPIVTDFLLSEKFHRNVPTKTDPRVAGESLLLFLRFSAEKGRSPAKSKIFFEIGKFLLTK